MVVARNPSDFLFLMLLGILHHLCHLNSNVLIYEPEVPNTFSDYFDGGFF